MGKSSKQWSLTFLLLKVNFFRRQEFEALHDECFDRVFTSTAWTNALNFFLFLSLYIYFLNIFLLAHFVLGGYLNPLYTFANGKAPRIYAGLIKLLSQITLKNSTTKFYSKANLFCWFTPSSLVQQTYLRKKGN